MSELAAASPAAGALSAASVEIDDWNRFYANEIEAAYRFLGAFIVLIVLIYACSGLACRYLVCAEAPEWNHIPLVCTRILGTVMIVAAAALLPLYAMFHPLLRHPTARDIVHIWAWAVLTGLFVVLFGLYVGSRWKQGGHALSRANLRTWHSYLLALITILTVANVLWWRWLNHPQPRLVIAYVVLILLGILATSVSGGQSRRILIEAKSGKGKGHHDESSTEYLLTRIQTLGLEQPKLSMHFARGSKAFSALGSADLTATPAGQIAGAVARLAYELRPSLAWHASVTFVDNGRVVMTLSRNGRSAAIDGFGREDLSLNAIDEKDQTSLDRARAQLLTGAAAFILLEMGRVYPQLKHGLCGATQWRSIALQVIASSQSLAADKECPPKLLRLATELDPANAIAQHTYIQNDFSNRAAGYGTLPAAETTAVAIAKRLDKLRKRILPEPRKPLPGCAGLALRVLHDSALNWLTLAARAPNRCGCLDDARTSVSMLQDLCDEMATSADDDLKQLAATFKRDADCFEMLIRVLCGAKEATRPAGAADGDPAPGLAFNYARLEALRLSRLSDEGDKCKARKRLFYNLAYAVASPDSKKFALTDPYLEGIRDNPTFMALVSPAPTTFLELDPYVPFAAKLRNAGFDTASRFVKANRQSGQRFETSNYLKVPSATVERLYELAAISKDDPELGEPGMLFLLLQLDIDSSQALRCRIALGVDPFRRELAAQAQRYGLQDLAGVKWSAGKWINRFQSVGVFDDHRTAA